MLREVSISNGYGGWNSGTFAISLPSPKNGMSPGQRSGLACNSLLSVSKFARWSENSMFNYSAASHAALS
jgi:hypothetical protein